jgi:hypothetical protein
VAQARAVQGALTQLEGSLSAAQMNGLYETARTILTAPDFAMLAHADAKYRGEWVDRVAKTMELDPADRPVLEAGVDELVGKLGKIHEDLGSGGKNALDYMIRCREAGAELVRQLSARFPDRKDKIVNALDPL